MRGQQHITLSQIQGFEKLDLELFRKRIEKEAERRRHALQWKLDLLTAIQRKLQEELVYAFRR